ncbi:hypothetical protein CO230_08665 [Chryseobacterium sp. 6424]|uniref:DUF6046 domain-containing protein n=1 Tax=Chryseobacterium sp. 6424 TaxID=2039166 RepID=UPI000EFB4E86|nr:DUF6046 domain-containing protein [Chryseobacterium sp. 6424]AYO58186.1 hypothetical protein CO230_08665 [Chryseobacterium sp. 6424]
MEFDIRKLTAQAFSYVGPAFPAWWAKNKTLLVLPSLNGIGAGLLMGKPYFQTLKVSYKGQQFVFPNEPLISLGLTKTIVETATVGKDRRGTVKEYINTEDYTLNIRGLCFNPETPELYPSEQVLELSRMFEINDSMEVIGSSFLELFQIRNLVFKSLELEDMAGMQGMQKYTVTAVSDQDFYADLAEKENNGSLLEKLG